MQWGLEHRQLAPIRAIGMDEIQYGRGPQYLTLVYQIESTCTRLLWVGKERTAESSRELFTVIGAQLASEIEFICSGMWGPYLQLIKQHCPNALNILDRFHIVAKMNKALDDVRAAEARQLVRDGYEPVLKKSRWCLLKRSSPEHLKAFFGVADLWEGLESLDTARKIDVERFGRAASFTLSALALSLWNTVPEVIYVATGIEQAVAFVGKRRIQVVTLSC